MLNLKFIALNVKLISIMETDDILSLIAMMSSKLFNVQYACMGIKIYQMFIKTAKLQYHHTRKINHIFEF